MNRLIKTSLALMLATLMSPALALQRDLPVSPDSANRRLDLELDRVTQQQSPLSGMETDLASAEGLTPQREVTMLASRGHKERDYGHYKPSKGKSHYRRHDGHDHYRGERRYYDHGHIHYYRPRGYWGYDRYYEYYDGINLNLILHLDG
jgi:hypothetical protein